VDMNVNRHLWLSIFQMTDDTVCTCSIVCCQVHMGKGVCCETVYHH
jgi:hypothetical protein